MDLGKLTTEKRNQNTMKLDEMSVKEVLKQMNVEDAKVPEAVKEALPQMEKTVKTIIDSFQKKGRLIYMGAGTSGRLGVLDAAECVPTFGVSSEMVVGLIAGGEKAMTVAVEGAEDSLELGKEDLVDLHLTANDTVVGIAASGRTPYVIGGLKYATEIGAKTVTIACNKEAKISKYSEIAIEIDAGPEILTGSTRLKAGTAQKMVLNMLSTGSMVKLGKVYGNLMVDVKPTNAKLMERAYSIIMDASDCDYDRAKALLNLSDQNVKTAIVMELCDLDKMGAENLLEENDGHVARSLKSVKNKGG